MNFLKKIIIKKPIQNSKLAKAKNKKEDVIKVNSSFIFPKITVIEYKITQIISEKRIKDSRLLHLIKKKKIVM